MKRYVTFQAWLCVAASCSYSPFYSSHWSSSTFTWFGKEIKVHLYMLKLNKTSTVEIHWSYHSSSLHHFVNGGPDGELKFPVTELHVHCIHVCDDWKLKCYKRFLYLLAGSSVYLVQFVLGYILMLAVMTYNANIFLAVIFGQSTHTCSQHRTSPSFQLAYSLFLRITGRLLRVWCSA